MSEYRRLPDGSGIITHDDGSETRLPPPFVVDVGPIYSTAEDYDAIRRTEDRITKLDREDRR